MAEFGPVCLAEFGWILFEFGRICSSLVEFGRIWSLVAWCIGRVWLSLVEFGLVEFGFCSSLVGFVQVWSSLVDFPRVSSNLVEFGRVGSILVEFSRIWSLSNVS